MVARKLTDDEKKELAKHRKKYGTSHAKSMQGLMVFKNMDIKSAHKEAIKRQKAKEQKEAKKPKEPKEEKVEPKVEPKPIKQEKPKTTTDEILSVMRDEKVNKLAQKLIKRLAKEENVKLKQ